METKTKKKIIAPLEKELREKVNDVQKLIIECQQMELQTCNQHERELIHGQVIIAQNWLSSLNVIIDICEKRNKF